MRPLVVCLCAAWCGSCRDYESTFEALGRRYGERADFAWVDVEDEADALGDLDIDDFPTLCIAAGERVVFLGPVTPQLQTADRLVRSALDGSLPEATAPPGLAARIRTAAACARDGRERRGSPR